MCDGEMTGEREFKGIWFPAEVWLDTRLTALEKMILMEIDSLDGDGGCWASNDYLADFCVCSKATVTRAISKLIELGYVRQVAFDGRTRVLRSIFGVDEDEDAQSEAQPLKAKQIQTSRPSHVYLFECGRKYKIGVSVNVERRMKDLDQRPFPVTLVASSRMIRNAYQIEQSLHEQFDDQRLNGEWFELSDEQVAYITEYLNKLGDREE